MSMQSSLPLTEKYRPQSIKDLLGVRNILTPIIKWLEDFPNVSRRAYLLLGPPGSGKTSLVHALAQDLRYDLVEVNASDTRNKDAIQHVIGLASQTRGLSEDSNMHPKLILIDEVDGISGTHDRGGLASLKKILRTTNVPIFLTANDPDSDKIGVLESVVNTIVFYRPCEPIIYFLLKRISEREGLQIKKTILREIAQFSMGDFRGAINDLESIATGGSFDPSFRDQAFTLLESLQQIFTSSSFEEARLAGRNFATSDYSSLLAFVNEIVAVHVTNVELRVHLLESVAHADLFLNRIRRTQNWGLLKYFFFDISAKIGYYLNLYREQVLFSDLAFPTKFKYLGQRKRMFDTRFKLALRVQPMFHTSINRIVFEIFPFLETIVLNNPERGAQILAWLNFSDEDVVGFLSKKKSKNVLPFMDSARKLVATNRIYRVSENDYDVSGPLLDSFLDSFHTSDTESEDVSDQGADDPSHALDSIDETRDSGKNQKTLDEFF